MPEREETLALATALDKIVAIVVEDAVRRTLSGVDEIMRKAKSEKSGEAAGSRLFTLDEAGAYIRRSAQAMRHLMRKREIPVVRDGSVIRFDRLELDKWIQKHTV